MEDLQWGNGSFKKGEVLAAVKHKKSRVSTTSYNAVVRENAQLRREVIENCGMLMAVYDKLGMDIPDNVLARWESQREMSYESDVEEASDGSEEHETSYGSKEHETEHELAAELGPDNY